MMQRFLTIGALPEIRTEPTDPEQGLQEIEVVLPVDTYWEVQEIIRQMRFAVLTGISSQRLWQRFSKLVYPCITYERDRLWFRKNIG